MTQESLIQKKRKREEQDRTGQERDFRLFIQFFFHFHSLHSLFIIIIACFCAWGGALAFPCLAASKKIGRYFQSAHFFAPFKKHSARPWHDLIFASPVFLFFFFDEKALRPTLARLSKYGSPTQNRLTYGRTRLLPTVFRLLFFF